MIIIPAIDLKAGQCVRLRRGVMSESSVFANDPSKVATKWAGQGAKRLHLVDLDGAFAGDPINEKIIIAIRKQHPDLIIQVGGGIRSLETAQRYIDAGIDYLIIGTKAITDENFVKKLCQTFPKRIMVGLDANHGYVAIEGWAKTTQNKAIDVAKSLEKAGVCALIYTDIAKDGMMAGVNYQETAELAKNIDLPVIASGGISALADLEKLKKHAHFGIEAAIVGRALYEGSLDFADSQRFVNQPL